MDIKSIYSDIEAKWYSLLDKAQAKGVPAYSIVDPIENMGIPTLPLFVGVMVVLLAIVAMLLMGGGGGAQATTVTVMAGGEPLAEVDIVWDGGAAVTDKAGVAKLDISGTISATLSKSGCESLNETIKRGDNIELEMQCGVAPPVGACTTLVEEYPSTFLY